MSRYRFIKAQQGTYPMRGLCRALGVAPSRYYAWQQGQQRAVGETAPAWQTALVAMFARHKSRSGTRRRRREAGRHAASEERQQKGRLSISYGD